MAVVLFSLVGDWLVAPWRQRRLRRAPRSPLFVFRRQQKVVLQPVLFWDTLCQRKNVVDISRQPIAAARHSLFANETWASRGRALFALSGALTIIARIELAVSTAYAWLKEKGGDWIDDRPYSLKLTSPAVVPM